MFSQLHWIRDHCLEGQQRLGSAIPSLAGPDMQLDFLGVDCFRGKKDSPCPEAPFVASVFLIPDSSLRH